MGRCGSHNWTGKTTYWLKDALVRVVGDSIPQRKVDRVILALSMSDILQRQAPVSKAIYSRERQKKEERTRISPVPGKNSPYLWKEQVMTLSVV